MVSDRPTHEDRIVALLERVTAHDWNHASDNREGRLYSGIALLEKRFVDPERYGDLLLKLLDTIGRRGLDLETVLAAAERHQTENEQLGPGADHGWESMWADRHRQVAELLRAAGYRLSGSTSNAVAGTAPPRFATPTGVERATLKQHYVNFYFVDPKTNGAPSDFESVPLKDWDRLERRIAERGRRDPKSDPADEPESPAPG